MLLNQHFPRSFINSSRYSSSLFPRSINPLLEIFNRSNEYCLIFSNSLSVKFFFEYCLLSCFGFSLLKSKTIDLEPMDLDEAILQMDLLAHDFFIYRDAEDNTTNVIYRREDGDIGLLEVKE